MAESFILSCESTVDLPYAYVSGRDMPVLFYTYTVDGQEYTDDMGRDPEALPRFYSLLEEGNIPTTSQLNLQTYLDFFETLLPKGDVLHIAFGSGMNKVHHQFYSVDLKYFRRSGRMSGAAATVAAILNICPIMRLNSAGKIIAYDKVRGRKNAIRRTVDTMEEHAQGGRNYSGKCFICHSNSLEDAEQTKIAVKERSPNISGDIRICDIGTIIASHCGPGTVAVFFYGDERAD